MRWPWQREPPTAAIAAGAGAPRKDISSGPLGLPVMGGFGEGNIPPYAPKVPPQPPHEQPAGRPGWWSAALPQSRLLYPDTALDILCEEMRRTVPILDRALTILVGLLGQVEFSGSKSAVADVNQWASRVKVNQTQRGLSVWLETHLDNMLLYGKGVGEVIVSHELKEVYALSNLDPRSIVFQVTPDPLVLLPLQRQHTNAWLASLNPETILISVNGGHTDTPHGWSLYRSLPYVAQCARIIENSTGQVWQRMGCPPFHINWDPKVPLTDPKGTVADAAVNALRSAWATCQSNRAVAAGGTGGNAVSDYFTTGTVKVEVMGHDHTPLPLAETWRVFEEQLVAVTGIPSWLLGFHWATTERMAAQQSEILTANIEALRRHVTPQIEQLLEIRQRFAGKSGRVKVGWSKVNLHDATEQARAKSWNAQARQVELANAQTMWALGFVTQAQALEGVDPDLGQPATPMPPPALPGTPPNLTALQPGQAAPY